MGSIRGACALSGALHSRHPAQLFADNQEGGAKGTIVKTTCAFALGLMKEALHMQTRI